MTDPRFDLELAVWLRDGPNKTSFETATVAFARARTTRQRPAWQVPAWWSTPGLPFDLAGARLLGLAVGALVLLLVGSLLLVWGHRSPLQPWPIVFTRSDSVYVASPDGSGAHEIYTPPAGFGTADVRWSPDHSRIALLIDSDTEGRVVILGPSGSVDGTLTTGLGYSLSWAPDGSRLALLDTPPSGSGSFTIMDSYGVRVGSISLPDGLRSSSWTGPISWSPDGRDIALPGCWAPCNPKVDAGLFRVAVEGSGVRQLSDQASRDTWLAWSSDGRLGASRGCFASGSECEPGVVAFGSDSAAQRLPGFDGFIAGGLSWSQDGRRVAAIGVLASKLGTQAATRLRIGGTDGSAVQLVPTDFTDLGQVEWSADDRSVLFSGVRRGSGTESIWSINVADGSLDPVVTDVELFDIDGRP